MVKYYMQRGKWEDKTDVTDLGFGGENGNEAKSHSTRSSLDITGSEEEAKKKNSGGVYKLIHPISRP